MKRVIAPLEEGNGGANVADLPGALLFLIDKGFFGAFNAGDLPAESASTSYESAAGAPPGTLTRHREVGSTAIQGSNRTSLRSPSWRVRSRRKTRTDG